MPIRDNQVINSVLCPSEDPSAPFVDFNEVFSCWIRDVRRYQSEMHLNLSCYDTEEE